jgi:hypothetical protein
MVLKDHALPPDQCLPEVWIENRAQVTKARLMIHAPHSIITLGNFTQRQTKELERSPAEIFAGGTLVHQSRLTTGN